MVEFRATGLPRLLQVQNPDVFPAGAVNDLGVESRVPKSGDRTERAILRDRKEAIKVCRFRGSARIAAGGRVWV